MAPEGLRGHQKGQTRSAEEVEEAYQSIAHARYEPSAFKSPCVGLKRPQWKNITFLLPWSLASEGVRGECKTFCVPQEPEWDVSSAFFANAASHIKPKGSGRKSKENKENEAKREVSGCKEAL